MGRKPTDKRNVRTIQKTGGGYTYVVTLPLHLIQELRWQKGQQVVIEKHDNGLFIRDWEPGE
jgi:antitoxin component of MazEF toxin-antitoxin module